MLGGDHSIGFPTVRGVCRYLGDRKVGTYFDRHVDTQGIDLNERMHTCPWFHATNMANAPANNLVHWEFGGWQVPRKGVKVCRERSTNVLTVTEYLRPSHRWNRLRVRLRSTSIASMPASFQAPAGRNPGVFCPARP